MGTSPFCVKMGLVRLWFGRFGVRELQSLGGSLSEGVGVQRTLRPFERNSSVPRLGMSFAQYLTILRLNRGNRRHGFAQIVRGGVGLILRRTTDAPGTKDNSRIP